MKKHMKNTKKIISLIIIISALMVNQKVFANFDANSIKLEEYTEEYKEWLKLSDEEKQKVLQPRIYDVQMKDSVSKNPLLKARMVGATMTSRYSLKDVIPENLSIRNQQETHECWAFATISSLETNLALNNYKNGINTSKVYDFSERHMDYATSKTFTNNIENPIGYNREVEEGGSCYIAQSYLTNGLGAINEEEMPFENNENKIEISNIQNKNVVSQVFDTVIFPNYQSQASDDKKIEVINQIKQHIKEHGSVYAQIHGDSANTFGFECYNNETGAKYCSSSLLHKADHGVSIIGWDDNYSVENFAEGARPTSKGAWIVRNSWGERLEYNLAELKENIYNTYKSQCNLKGWTEPSLIPNEFIQENGYTIEGDIAYIKIGDNGLMYVSYEDKNISQSIWGIVKAADYVSYDNIYLYDELYPLNILTFYKSDIILCNNFNKKTSGTEFLNEVALDVPETCTCKVYVNPNGTGKTKKDMQLVQLKAGESEICDPGYHTLEFANALEINAETFAVAIELQSQKSSVKVQIEAKVANNKVWDNVKTESGKCFLGNSGDFDTCEWIDLSNLSSVNASLPNGDSSIKAFTTNTLNDGSLKNIEIVTPPTKTSYFEGENFDKTGMAIKANYNSKTKPSEILDSSNYNITNGTNLTAGQTSVNITYEDKSVNQSITVEKNSVTELKIKNPPVKTEYKEGQNFDKTGMIVEATFKNGTKKEITDYTIKDGNNVDVSQTKVTISYDEKTVEQPITVIPNPLIEIKITKSPNKTQYVVGQDFDKTGMVVTGTYQDESTVEIKEYTIENGANLQEEQEYVTIKFKDKSVNQAITVEEKSIVGIFIEELPSKLAYIHNKEEIDISDGILKIEYNDETTEEIDMTTEGVVIEGFDNSKLGKEKITITYEGKEVQFEVEIVEEEKAENSKLDNIGCIVKNVKAYLYENINKNDYILMDVEINGIDKNLNNDSLEYYYYLSTNSNEQSINDWVKISNIQEENDKIKFSINSKDVKNYNELVGEDVIYLYIKEVAIKAGNQSIAVSKAIKFEENGVIAVYIDDVKQDSMKQNYELDDPINEQDFTVSTNELPNTGEKILIIVAILVVGGIGIFVYIRYRILNKYTK